VNGVFFFLFFSPRTGFFFSLITRAFPWQINGHSSDPRSRKKKVLRLCVRRNLWMV
jgi:hypothetical protein